MKNKKTIVNEIAEKVIQYLEQKYNLIRQDGDMKKCHSELYELIEKCLLRLNSNIPNDEKQVDCIAKAIAQELALVAYWDIFQRQSL